MRGSACMISATGYGRQIRGVSPAETQNMASLELRDRRVLVKRLRSIAFVSPEATSELQDEQLIVQKEAASGATSRVSAVSVIDKNLYAINMSSETKRELYDLK